MPQNPPVNASKTSLANIPKITGCQNDTFCSEFPTFRNVNWGSFGIAERQEPKCLVWYVLTNRTCRLKGGSVGHNTHRPDQIAASSPAGTTRMEAIGT